MNVHGLVKCEMQTEDMLQKEDQRVIGITSSQTGPPTIHSQHGNIQENPDLLLETFFTI